MATDPITIELLNPIRRVCTGERLPLHLVIRCPSGGKTTELQHIGTRNPKATELESDLFERDLTLQPGEVYRCAIAAQFRAVGTFPEPLFYLQASCGGQATLVRVPTPPIQVVPSLRKEIQLSAESICTYDYGTKVDVTIKHVGHTKFDDFRLTVGPTEKVRAGVSEQRRPSLAHGDTIKFTTVVEANVLELTLDATTGGEQIGPVSVNVTIPAVRDAENTPQFRFLEPKKLTQADVIIRTMDEESETVRPHAGVHEIYGGGTKYRVDIKPAHPNVTNVNLRGVSGSVEVTDMPSDPGTGCFQMVVVSNSVFTNLVTLHYDVTTPEGLQQGELNLSIRPSSAKLWLVALTAGAAVTVKGVAAIVPAILNPGDVWSTLSQVLTKVDTIWELLQFLSIPVIRAGLWVVDRIVQLFQD